MVPEQAHFALEPHFTFRLITRWTRLRVAIAGRAAMIAYATRCGAGTNSVEDAAMTPELIAVLARLEGMFEGFTGRQPTDP